MATLSDGEIKSYCKDQKLISNGFEESCLKQACYELRASNIYHTICSGVDTCHKLEAEDFIIIKPKETVVIITMEELNLPDDILARVLTKGKLFTVGIAPVNTYADPGFKGKLGIVMNNLSHNYLRIDQGSPIAKIEFSELRQNVESPYRGQHGYSAGVWPVDKSMILSDKEAASHPRVYSETVEIGDAFGPKIGRLIKRVYKYESWLIMTSLLVLTLNLLLGVMISKDKFLTVSQAVITSLISNIIFGLITFWATRLKK